MKKLNIYFLLILMFLTFTHIVNAQCAMCKASAESSLQNGATIVNGVNSGIVYLMGIPYILLAIFSFVFRQDIALAYHRWRKTEVDAKASVFRQYRFLFFFFAALTVLFLLFAYIQLKQ